VAVLAWGCAGPTSGPRLEPGTPILLISIDTLRADHLPAYGYTGVDTPALDALRRDAILFERAFSHAPITLPSHTSILTGLPPTEHGVRDNLGVRLEWHDDLPFLPRALAALDYATGAVVSSYVLQRETGLAAGFDHYDDTIDKINKRVLLQRSGEESLARAVAWMDSVGERPFFLFFHIYEPHTPYEPPEPFKSRYASPYDGEIALADRIIGGLIDELRARDLYERSLIVLLSDHGESLGDHGEFDHGVFLYRSTQHVPLLLKLPRGERGGTSVGRQVGLVDVYPTILELVGLPVASSVAAVSLLAAETDPQRSLYAEALYARAHLGWSELTSLIGPRFQLIDAPRPELYDLIADPEQRHNLIETERRAAAEMRAELERLKRPWEPRGEIDEQTLEQMAALGYVSSEIAAGDGPLPDPKDRVESLLLLKEANRKFHQGEFEGAAADLERLIELEPLMVDAMDLRAKALLRCGRPEEALAEYQRALAMTRDKQDRLALAVAGILMSLKRLDEAEAHLLLFPDDLEAISMLGEIAVRKGDLRRAEVHLERSIELGAPPLNVKKLEASIALARGAFQRAIELTVEAEELLRGEPNKDYLKTVFFTRARAQAQLGLTAEAEASLLEELEIDSSQLEAFAHLALLHAVQNRGAEVGRTLKRMIDENPGPLAVAEAVRTLRFIGDERAAAAVLADGLSRFPGSPELRALAG
jgi:arylsulfatase A-like enzyme/Tfp pilus assembly protein PilF